MIRRFSAAAGVFLLLTGCGTLKINIDYGVTSTPAAVSAGAEVTETGKAVSTSTIMPSSSPLPGKTQTDTPGEAAPPAAKDAVVALAAGRSHTCALTAGGAVKCWGNNEHGQLGDGTFVSSNIPVDVDGITDAKYLTAGWGHTCALTADGGVKCWGYNSDGELGNGGMWNQSRPVDVDGLSSGVIAVDSGDYHTCAVTDNHRLKCWGKNAYGQLGDWTKESSNLPVESPFFGGGVADAAAGWGHTCVQTTEGWAKCWGNNTYGQMGFGKLTDIHLPAEDVVNLNGRVLAVKAAGNQTCALTAGGGVQCWGDNRYGQLGDGTNQKQYEPAQVTGLTAGVTVLADGGNHACAVGSGGELRCWGWNFYGQLGDGTTVNQYAPVRVQYLTDGVTRMALGWGHTCVLIKGGAVKCWGLNGSGQLGDGTWTDSKVPLTVIGVSV